MLIDDNVNVLVLNMEDISDFISVDKQKNKEKQDEGN